MRISDWSSDVCSSDLGGLADDRHQAVAQQADQPLPDLADVGLGRRRNQRPERLHVGLQHHHVRAFEGDVDRKSVVSGKRVSVRVELGGRLFIKKKNEKNDIININYYYDNIQEK